MIRLMALTLALSFVVTAPMSAACKMSPSQEAGSSCHSTHQNDQSDETDFQGQQFSKAETHCAYCPVCCTEILIKAPKLTLGLRILGESFERAFLGLHYHPPRDLRPPIA